MGTDAVEHVLPLHILLTLKETEGLLDPLPKGFLREGGTCNNIAATDKPKLMPVFIG